jgi:spermidine synthase
VVAGRTVLLVERAAPRVLILGYGLGAMASVALHHRPAARIVGVESSAERAAAARALAGPGRAAPGADVRCADALSFLRRTRARFDLIIDDCFELARDGDTFRSPSLYEHAAAVRARLLPDGLYVRNLLPQQGIALDAQWRDVRASFRYWQLRRFREWENVLVVASDRLVAASAWRHLRR